MPPLDPAMDEPWLMAKENLWAGSFPALAWVISYLGVEQKARAVEDLLLEQDVIIGPPNTPPAAVTSLVTQLPIALWTAWS